MLTQQTNLSKIFDKEFLIIRPNIGYQADFGDVYDIFNEQFVGSSVFKKKIPPSNIQSVPSESQSTTSILSSKITNNLRALGVDGDLTLSVLTNAFSLSIFAKILNATHLEHKIIQSGFLHCIRTVTEKIDITDEAIFEYYRENPSFEAGTHFVIGIGYGAKALAILNVENQHKDMEFEWEAKLRVNILRQLSSIGINISPEIKGRYKTENNIDLENSQLIVHADFLQDSGRASKSWSEAMELIDNMQRSFTTTGDKKGLPQEYYLLPLSHLKKILPISFPEQFVYQPIDNSSVNRFEILFEKIAKAKIEIQALDDKIQTYFKFIKQESQDRVTEYFHKFCQAETNLKNELKAMIREIRTGQKDSFDLGCLWKEFHDQSDVSPIKAREFIRSCSDIKEKIVIIKQLMDSNIEYIVDEIELLEYRNKHSTCDIYMLFFNINEHRELPEWNETIEFMKTRSSLNSKQQPERLYVCIDTEIGINIMSQEKLSPGLKICRWQNFVYNCKDVIKEMQKLKTRRSVMCGNSKKIFTPNHKCIPIKFPCPNSIYGRCDKIEELWTCETCENFIEYGFDDKFYCDCGFGDIYDCLFKCPNPNHGINPVKFEQETLSNLLAKMTPRQEINILLLGETGNGKSTWINMIPYYLFYETLDLALNEELINLIPTKFLITQKAENISTEITIDSSPNECYEEGQSATKKPRAYTFKIKDKLYRFIDTPGIGDSHGIEQDMKNMDSVLKFASRYETLHGICILLKPNDARLTPRFAFCFKELLTQFHSSAIKNIVFCFTNSSAYKYEVSATITPLSVLLKEVKDNKNVEIPLTQHTMYSFDNMSYQFICVKHFENLTAFSKEDHADHALAYEKSRLEFLKLLRHVEVLDAYKSQSSLSINYARQLVKRLRGPLTQLTISFQKAMLKTGLKALLALPALLGAMVGDVSVNIVKGHFLEKKVCKRCAIQKPYYDDERFELVNRAEYRADLFIDDDCGKMKNPFVDTIYTELNVDKDGNFSCTNCKDKFIYHEEFIYKFTLINQVLRFVSSKTVYSIAEDRNKVIKAIALFGHFLKFYSLTTYNDAIEQYLEYQISNADKNNDRSQIEALNEMLKLYKHEQSEWENEIKKCNKDFDEEILSSENIMKSVEELKGLKYFGEEVQKIIYFLEKSINLDMEEEPQEYHFQTSGKKFRKSKDKCKVISRNLTEITVAR